MSFCSFLIFNTFLGNEKSNYLQVDFKNTSRGDKTSVQVFYKDSKAFISCFATLHLIFVWKETTKLTPYITILIVFTSGVEKGGFSVPVNDGGQKLESTVN